MACICCSTISDPSCLFKFRVSLFFIFAICLLSWPNQFSIGATSGQYGGIKTVLHSRAFKNSKTSFALCTGELSIRIIILPSELSWCSLKWPSNLLKYWINILAFIIPFTNPVKLHPSEEIELMRLNEPCTVWFLIKPSFSFHNHEYCILVDLPTEASSIFTSSSYLCKHLLNLIASRVLRSNDFSAL